MGVVLKEIMGGILFVGGMVGLALSINSFFHMYEDSGIMIVPYAAIGFGMITASVVLWSTCSVASLKGNLWVLKMQARVYKSKMGELN